MDLTLNLRKTSLWVALITSKLMMNSRLDDLGLR